MAALQRRLGIPDDGIFGPQTDRAVKAFQLRNGLDRDGIVGPLTRRALSGDLGRPFGISNPPGPHKPPFPAGPLYSSTLKDLSSSTPVVFWSGGKIAEQVAAKTAKQRGGLTLEMTRAGRALVDRKNSGELVPREEWLSVSRKFARTAGFLNQPKLSVIKIPARSPSIRTEELRTYAKWNMAGRAARTGGLALGIIGTIPTAVFLSDTFSGRMEINWPGRRPSDYAVGHEFQDVDIGDGVYVKIRVERTIPWVGGKRFYIVDYKIPG